MNHSKAPRRRSFTPSATVRAAIMSLKETMASSARRLMPWAILRRPVIFAMVAIFLTLIYIWFVPPPPRSFEVTSPRVKLPDGRYLSYREVGVDRVHAKYRFVVSHGFGSSKFMDLRISNDTMEELGLYFVFYDRPGYGESDPHPSRTVKTAAYDIQNLADELGLGPKFYVLGVSLGCSTAYSCLNYIPDRLAGVVLVAPFINYWWTKVPQEILDPAFQLMPEGDQWTFKVAHYAPSLLYWWCNQKLFPSKNLDISDRALASDQDLVVNKEKSMHPTPGSEKARQQGDYESVQRDLIAGFATWEFDPTDLKNPYEHKNGSVHIWQGTEDRIISREVSQYISKILPWIEYHEVQGLGHLLNSDKETCEQIIRKLFV